jgi:hypothetical protein
MFTFSTKFESILISFLKPVQKVRLNRKISKWNFYKSINVQINRDRQFCIVFLIALENMASTSEVNSYLTWRTYGNIYIHRYYYLFHTIISSWRYRIYNNIVNKKYNTKLSITVYCIKQWTQLNYILLVIRWPSDPLICVHMFTFSTKFESILISVSYI